MKARLTREAHKEIVATGKAPVYLRLTLNRAVSYVATGTYLLASEWDQKTQTVLGRGEHYDDMRSALKIWTGDAEKLAQQHRKTPNMTIARYKELLLGKEERTLTLLAVADAFYQNKARPELRKAMGTLRRYRCQRAALESYLVFLKALSLSVATVDLAWLRRFERWCLSVQQYALSTTRKYVGYVQEVVDFAAHETWLPFNPVARYRFEAESGATDPAYLPEAQVQQLVQLTGLPRILERARLAWLFCCYTGLSYVDYFRFEPAEHLHTDPAGRQWVRMERQKTGATVSVPVLPELTALLLGCELQIPKLDRSYMSRRLKPIAARLQLAIPLNSGLARHTASHRLRNVLGFTDEEAAAILGHSKEVQHSNYSRKREEGLALALDRIGVVAPAPAAPTLRQQLEAALAATDAPELREKLLALLKELPD